MDKLTETELRARLKSLTDTMVFSSDRFTLKGKADFKCLKCGRINKNRIVEHFFTNPVCGYCNGTLYDTEKLKQVLKDKYGDRFTLLSEYKSMRDNITVLCNQCKQEQTVVTQQLVQGGTCQHCKMFTSSQGEQVVYEILEHNNINFKYQYSVKNSQTGNWVLFDFYLPNSNIYIEFQGSQHFNKDNRYYSDSYHQRDLWKKSYVRDIGATLIYLDQLNLSDILSKLSKYLGKLNTPTKLSSGNFYLPIYQIYSDSREMQTKDVCTKYGIGSTKLDMIIKLYKDTDYEKPQVKTETKYAPVKVHDQVSFEKELARVSNNRYDVLGKYKDSKTRILVHCHVCNQTYEVIPKNIVRPKNMESMGCKYCEGSYAKTRKQAQKLVDYMYPNQYVLPEDYSGVAHKIDILCTKCNTTSSKKPTQILTGNGCRCSSKRYGDNSSANPKMSLDGANKLLLKHLTD